MLCKHEVVGSIPSGSTTTLFQFFLLLRRFYEPQEQIMAVPKRKVTKSKRDMRRAHDSLSTDAYVEDKVTGELHRPHHIDLKTGMYGGRQVVKVKDRF